jgi:hypothetical protein
MEATSERATRPDPVEAALRALLPQLPVGRVFRSSDGGESWTRSDLETFVSAFTDPGRATGR